MHFIGIFPYIFSNIVRIRYIKWNTVHREFNLLPTHGQVGGS